MRLGRTTLFKLVALALSLGLAFLAAEAAVRVRQWVRYGSASPSVHDFEVDRETGLRVPAAGSSRAGIVINRLGFRGPELSIEKPAGTIRLAFLGASTTYCAEVSSNAATWPHLVTAKLSEAFPEARFDYVNAAVPGYSVDDSHRRLRAHVERLAPDIIVIYHATNDLSGDTRKLARARGLFDDQTQRMSALSEWSTLWYLLEKNWDVRRGQEAVREGVERLTFDPPALSKAFEKRLASIVADAKTIAGITAVATFSHRLRREQSEDERIAAASTSLYYMPYMGIEGLLDGFEEYNRVIRHVATDQGVILVDGEDTIPADAAHFADSVHFTDQGAAAMAERVAAALTASSELRALAHAARGIERP